MEINIVSPLVIAWPSYTYLVLLISPHNSGLSRPYIIFVALVWTPSNLPATSSWWGPWHLNTDREHLRCATDVTALTPGELFLSPLPRQCLSRMKKFLLLHLWDTKWLCSFFFFLIMDKINFHRPPHIIPILTHVKKKKPHSLSFQQK